MLFYTGIVRTASDIAHSYVGTIGDKHRQLRILRELVDEGTAILRSDEDISRFGQLLHKAWKVKRSLSSAVSNSQVDQLYARARAAGALGGKLVGAGGGGFFLLFVPPDRQLQVRHALDGLTCVPFQFENTGSQIVFADAKTNQRAVDSQSADQDSAEYGGQRPRRAA